MESKITLHRISRLKQSIKRNYIFPFFVLLPGLITSVISESIFPLFFFLGFALIVLLIGMTVTNGTKSIEFNNSTSTITIKKKEKEMILTDNIQYQRVEHKSFWNGLKIKSNRKIIYIWQHEFSDKDWRIIRRELKQYLFIKKKENIYTSWLPTDLYIEN